jgi:superfamily II DNA or RNA helicase
MISSPVYLSMGLIKLGKTINPYARRSTYLTGCPPNLTPSQDLEFIAIWETTADCDSELRDYEDALHDYFHAYRMMRSIPNDTEWFNFGTLRPIEYWIDLIKSFITSRPWFKREMPLHEVIPVYSTRRYLSRQLRKNLKYIRNESVRNERLSKLQEPVIQKILEFVDDADNLAGVVIAPCGSGKTLMCVIGIKKIARCIICCPSTHIQQQWRDTIKAIGLFSDESIYLVGGEGTTDCDIIKKWVDNERYCILTTYKSSYLLERLINDTLELIVCDEAHHMAGIISDDCSDDGTGEGATRRLMRQACDIGIKRISLTFTPRFVYRDESSRTEYFSMDDEKIFGSKIAELDYRTLIQEGVLPDYRVWMMRDEAMRGKGIIGKAECIKEAWNAKEASNGDEKFIINHLIVFVQTNDEGRLLETYFNENTEDTLILRVGDDIKIKTRESIKRFEEAPRAIIINCFILGEGVDIPCADSVAIMYPKKSRGQTTQMILRAGRWYQGKSVFHILIPTLGDEDLSGFEEVLIALASCDSQICDEIVFRARKEIDTTNPTDKFSEFESARPENIMIDEVSADADEIRTCFTNVRKNIFTTKDARRIQRICLEKGIDTSIEYADIRTSELPELPENPISGKTNWYDFLHPLNIDRISPIDFVKNILEPNSLKAGHRYDEWRGVQPSDILSTLPSVQHITDGYFGEEYSNFNVLFEKFATPQYRRGR